MFPCSGHSSVSVKAPSERNRHVFKTIQLIDGWKISALLFLPSVDMGKGFTVEVLAAGEGVCVCVCVCWVMTGGTTGCLRRGLLFRSATTNEPQSRRQWGRTSSCDALWRSACGCKVHVPTHQRVRSRVPARAFVQSVCLSVYSWRSKLPPLLAERRGAVNLRWLEATGKLNELSKPRRPPSLWQNASMLCASWGAMTRGHGRCLSFT